MLKNDWRPQNPKILVDGAELGNLGTGRMECTLESTVLSPNYSVPELFLLPGQQIQLGIECATSLLDSGDFDLPRLAENEAKRKERWRLLYRKPGWCVTDVENLENRGKL